MVQLPASPESFLQVSYQIRNKGSFTIPDEARKSHRLILDIEVVSVTRTQYQNFLYNMPQGDYCNVTFWSGSAISRTEKIKYPSQRLIDWINIEASLCLNAAGVGVTIIETIKSLGAALELTVTETDGQSQAVWGYPITHVKVVCPEDTQILLTCTWYPFETTPLVNDIEPQIEEPSDSEDEYKSPSRNPSSNPWAENAPASLPQPDRDIRDYPFQDPDEGIFFPPNPGGGVYQVITYDRPPSFGGGTVQAFLQDADKNNLSRYSTGGRCDPGGRGIELLRDGVVFACASDPVAIVTAARFTVNG